MKVLCFAAALLSAVVTEASSAAPPKEHVLYAFRGANGGTTPTTGVIADDAGNLYGALYYGGTHNNGTIYKLVRPSPGEQIWKKVTIYNVQDGIAESGPSGPLVFDRSGALYGTTAGGAVFKLVRGGPAQETWTATIIYRFPSERNGPGPEGLTIDKHGVLYGVTYQGGDLACEGGFGCGFVYSLAPPQPGKSEWTKTVLHAFSGGSDGAIPFYPPTVAGDGALYGTTPSGGDPSSVGIVYKLSPPSAGHTHWTEQVLHRFRFDDASNGLQPIGGVALDKTGAVFGTTASGGHPGGCSDGDCGTVFKLEPAPPGHVTWKQSVLLRLSGEGDGGFPNKPVIADRDGSLYVSTNQGGSLGGCGAGGCGVLLKLTPPGGQTTTWTETVIHQFLGGYDGAFPNEVLVSHALGAILGTATGGGVVGDCSIVGECGVVFDFRLR